jgi:hypothetical protein
MIARRLNIVAAVVAIAVVAQLASPLIADAGASSGQSPYEHDASASSIAHTEAPASLTKAYPLRTNRLHDTSPTRLRSRAGGSVPTLLLLGAALILIVAVVGVELRWTRERRRSLRVFALVSSYGRKSARARFRRRPLARASGSNGRRIAGRDRTPNVNLPAPRPVDGSQRERYSPSFGRRRLEQARSKERFADAPSMSGDAEDRSDSRETTPEEPYAREDTRAR